MFGTALFRWGYAHVLKPWFFLHDPEDVHDGMIRMGARLGRYGWSRAMLSGCFSYADPMLEQQIHGTRFPNPVGLGGGFDKNAELTQILPAVGFGFMEVGSITGEPCPGNPRPRLWRIPASESVLVYYGLKNNGCEEISSRLRGVSFAIPLGTNVAKTNSPETVSREKGIADYAKAFRACADVGSYMTVNISCPNAFGGEPFTTPEALEELLQTLDTIGTPKPVFVKFPADLSFDAVDALIEVLLRHRVHGVIATNLTKRKDVDVVDQASIAGHTVGGLGGRPVQRVSDELVSHLYRRVGTRLTIIGLGGIFSAEDAYEKICRGASLVQLVTGMIYRGPQMVGEINRGLVALLKRDGFNSIADAVGSRER